MELLGDLFIEGILFLAGWLAWRAFGGGGLLKIRTHMEGARACGCEQERSAEAGRDEGHMSAYRMQTGLEGTGFSGSLDGDLGYRQERR